MTFINYFNHKYKHLRMSFNHLSDETLDISHRFGASVLCKFSASATLVWDKIKIKGMVELGVLLLELVLKAKLVFH